MIAIRRMEIPKSCSECKLCVEDKYADMTCVLLCDEWEESDYNENHRDERCPLVEIITCKDCKHWVKDLTSRVPDDKEYHFCPMIDFNTSEDYYCADAERRE